MVVRIAVLDPDLRGLPVPKPVRLRSGHHPLCRPSTLMCYTSRVKRFANLLILLASTVVAIGADQVRTDQTEQQGKGTNWTAVLEAKVEWRFADNQGRAYCFVAVSNKTARTQTFKVWSEYSTNAGVWKEFSMPNSFGLRAGRREMFDVPAP